MLGDGTKGAKAKQDEASDDRQQPRSGPTAVEQPLDGGWDVRPRPFSVPIYCPLI